MDVPVNQIRDQAAIVGIGSTPFSKGLGRSEFDMAVEAILAACADAGISPRDAAVVFGSMMRTAQAVALQGGNASAVPAGSLRDNALLLERNEAELRRLSQRGGQS